MIEESKRRRRGVGCVWESDDDAGFRRVTARSAAVLTPMGRARRARVVFVEHVGPPLLTLVLITTIWESAARLQLFSEIAIPPASSVASGVVFLGQRYFFWESLWVTFVETALGFFAGSAIGLTLGIVSGVSPLFRRALYPYVVLFQSFPKSALAPLLLVWFGFGLMSKFTLAATMAFFPVVVNALSSFAKTRKSGLLLMQVYGASRSQMAFKLLIPDSMPDIFAGLKTGISLALVGAIIAEFVGALKGLGTLLESFNFGLQMDLAFAVLVYLAVLGFLLYWVAEQVEKKVVFWRGASL